MSVDYQIYDLGNLALQRGATIRDCKLAYKTFGQLNAAKDNVIVYPTWYSGQHYDNEWLIGPGMALLQPGKIIAGPADREQPHRELIVECEIAAAARCAAATRAQAGRNPGGKVRGAGMRQQLLQPADRKTHRFRTRLCELAKRGKNGGEVSGIREPRQHLGHLGE